MHRYVSVSSTSFEVQSMISIIPSLVSMSSLIACALHSSPIGTGSKPFLEISLHVGPVTGSAPQLSMIRRIFSPVMLRQSFPTTRLILLTTILGDVSSFSVKVINRFWIAHFRCSILLIGSIRYRWVLLSSPNILLIDVLHVLKSIFASLPCKFHRTEPYA